MAFSLVSPALSEAQDAVPVSPRDGATLIGARSVVLGWNLPLGSESEAVSLAKRAETSYPGGPFLAPLRDTPLSGPDRAYLLTDLDPGRYYWHVQAAHCTAPPDEYGYCPTGSSYGPTASFINLDALSERDARIHVRDLVSDEVSESVEISSNRCTRVSKLRARCLFSGFIGDGGYSGRGNIYYKRDLRDNLRYYHFKFRVTVQDFYCRYGLRRPWRRCIRTEHWRG